MHIAISRVSSDFFILVSLDIIIITNYHYHCNTYTCICDCVSFDVANEVKVSPLFDDLCSVLYNRTFKTIVCVSKAGSVAIYNIEDGSDVNRFTIPNNTPIVKTMATVDDSNNHNNNGNNSPDRTIDSTASNNKSMNITSSSNHHHHQQQHHQRAVLSSNFITMACLDGADKRLIIYTHIGVVQFWNYTTGILLFEVHPQVPTSMGMYIYIYIYIYI